MLLMPGFKKKQTNPGINMWYADRQNPAQMWRSDFTHHPLIGYCLAGSSCSHDPDWWMQGRNGCLLVVSVTHTTPPGGRLCLVVMIHHSWLSGTILSEDHDIIPISSWEEDEKRGAHPNKPRDLGVLIGVSEVWNSG